MSLEALLVIEPFRRKIKSPRLSRGIITGLCSKTKMIITRTISMILFSYDEKIKSSNSKGFFLAII